MDHGLPVGFSATAKPAQLLAASPRHPPPSPPPLPLSATPAHSGGGCYVPCPISTAATSHSPRTDVPSFGDSPEKYF